MSDDYDHFATQMQFLFLCSGEWGSVCAEGFELSNANAVCEQLGYFSALTSPYHEQGCGRIWMSYITCRFGWYSRLDDCTFSGWGKRSCSHSRYAIVICGKTITMAEEVAVYCLYILLCKNLLFKVFINKLQQRRVKELLIDN